MEAVRETFAQLTEVSILLIDFMALLIVVYGTLEAFWGACRAAVTKRRQLYHQIWIRYARWLVAGLTFQLAADIIESALTPSWEDVGRLAAIAVVRTFLNYFLGRDLSEETEQAMTAEEAKAVDPRSPGAEKG
ncbi:MAG: DUF1622 domain-containing protein [Mesorhizobium sp.]|uniref:DUF1622 domain-containing protein n=1 Tax=Mesorhizobium sp. TaxID=1871066 RepID=UPI000FE6F0E9|nr:DUF1622 domain-containing protein [Mesorhizobium sp.]RWF46489.1 MAG: DUF1622 domain-containing protein [Mesorhizobium sp.]